MFAHTATFQWKTDKLDEAIKVYQDSVIPAVKAQKGSRSIYFVVRETKHFPEKIRNSQQLLQYRV